jgi:hypothetical protein
MRMVPTGKQLKQSWEKYSLIVVGNIVFFLLLYFISYRPHNEENRASEFLSLAQQEDADDHYRSAMVLYQKVLADYGKTRSAQTAKSRLAYLKKNPPRPAPKKKPEKIQPILDIDKMLDVRPAVYVAKFLAEHYDDKPNLKPRLKQAIGDYLKMAINYEGIPLGKLRTEKEFQREEFQKSFFSIRTGCEMKADWVYDDFYIVNTGIFPWTNVRLRMTVAQGDKKETAEIRIPRLAPGRKFEVTSFNVDKGGGDVVCRGTLKTREGASSFRHRL